VQAIAAAALSAAASISHSEHEMAGDVKPLASVHFSANDVKCLSDAMETGNPETGPPTVAMPSLIPPPLSARSPWAAGSITKTGTDPLPSTMPTAHQQARPGREQPNKAPRLARAAGAARCPAQSGLLVACNRGFAGHFFHR
jgi:hypothetical protein